MFSKTAVLPWKGLLMTLACTCLLLFSTATEAEGVHPFAGGDGSSTDPYQITNVEQLQAVGGHLTSRFILNNDIDASATLGWNIGDGFDPIGDWGAGAQFTGHFDGRGFAITNLHINRPTENYVGLFGLVGTGGTITNIGVVGGTITGKNRVGGLVGGNYGGTIKNSHATGAVNGTNDVGDLVGFNIGPVTNSYSAGAVNGITNVGGFIGQNNGTITASFWDRETSGQTVGAGAGDPTGVSGKTTLEMKQQATFAGAGWAFGGIWDIMEEITYPFHKWAGPPPVIFVTPPFDFGKVVIG